MPDPVDGPARRGTADSTPTSMRSCSGSTRRPSTATCRRTAGIATDSVYCYHGHVTRTISQAELRNGSAGVMDALESGEDFVITRNGVPVGELTPIRRSRQLTAEDVVREFAGLSGKTAQAMRDEADRVFGSDRLTDG